MFRQLLSGSIGLVVVTSLSCSDDGPDVLEDACRVVVDDCGVGTSVGACLDDLGNELDACLDCIASGGCDYPSRCGADATDAGGEPLCVLPPAYVP